MWNLWTKSKTYNQLPSEVLGEEDSIAAWMLDSAITWFGITIENALQERVETTVGKVTKSQPRYTLARLLHKDFRLPKPAEEKEIDVSPWGPLFAWAGKRGSKVKRYKYQKPVD